jgi:hypothetical protein
MFQFFLVIKNHNKIYDNLQIVVAIDFLFMFDHLVYSKY